MLVKFGNKRLGNDTMILNMGSATDCPSRRLGLCLIPNKCYAYQSERMYKAVLPYRRRQQAYWTGHNEIEIAMDLSAAIERRRYDTKWFRFNESGDFWSPTCIDKLNYIALVLHERHGIITHGYTARQDLSEYFRGSEFIVRGSGFDLPMGKTFTVPKDTPIGWSEEFQATVCSGVCATCDLTRSSEYGNIAMRLTK